MESSAGLHKLKRKDPHDDTEEGDLERDSTHFKKARHQWQIKGDKSCVPQMCSEADRSQENAVNEQKALSYPLVNSTLEFPRSDTSSKVDDINGPIIHCGYVRDVYDKGKEIRNAGTSNDTTISNFVNHLDTDNENTNVSNDDVQQIHISESLNLSSASRLSIESEIFDTSRLSYSDSVEHLESVTDNLTHKLEKWQNKHVAKSIVDNAINKTLEEMGVSPEIDQQEFTVENSQIIEVQGISEAIRSQGLVPQVNHPMHPQRMTPILSHLRQASDLVFTQTCTSDFIQTQRASTCITGSRSPSESRSQPESPQQVSETNGAIMQQPPGSSHMSNLDLLDHAVSMAICSQGLTLQNHI